MDAAIKEVWKTELGFDLQRAKWVNPCEKEPMKSWKIEG